VKRRVLDPDVMLPALGQGTLCVQARRENEAAMAACARINDIPTELATAAERAFVAALDGSCRTPMAGLAIQKKGVLRFEAQILTLDGTRSLRREREIAIAGRDHEACLLDALAAGAEMGAELAEEAGPALRAMLAR